MDQPKRRTRPGVGFVLLVFALVAGLSLGATAALNVGHPAMVPGVSSSAVNAPAAKEVSSAGVRPAASANYSFLRVLNAVPGTDVDGYLNGTLAFASLGFARATGYFPSGLPTWGYQSVYSGIWNVSFYVAGSTPVAANFTYNTTVSLTTGTYYTLALIGTATTVSSVLLTDSNAAPAASNFNVRFFQASPNQTATSIAALNPLTGATNWTIASTAFGAVSAYQGDPNASVNVTAVLTATTAVLVYNNNTAFTTNDYTIAMVGNNTTNAPLELLYLLDGSYSSTPYGAGMHPLAVGVTADTALSTYTVLPTSFVFGLSVTNSSILPFAAGTGTHLWLNVTDFATKTLCQSTVLDSSVYAVAASTVAYPSVPTWGTVASATWVVDLTSALVVNTTACPSFAGDSAIISLAAVVVDPNNGTTSAGTSEQTAFVWQTPTSALHVSSTTAAPTTFTIYATYSAQYVGRVALSVYNPATGLLTFSANLIWAGGKQVNATWLETVAGDYPYTLSVYTTYGAFNTSGYINVLPPGQTYYNSTTWTNSTLISGLSSSAAGTILLIVGLLIGMIVAMVVGRMVWGGPKTVPPAQPWSAQKPETPNTCSVCGKSFGTPEELAAHSKSEHGMQ